MNIMRMRRLDVAAPTSSEEAELRRPQMLAMLAVCAALSCQPAFAATERISVSSAGSQAAGDSTSASISSDGRFVSFVSNAPNLAPLDTNGVADVFLRDRQNGTTERVSVGNGGLQANGKSTDPAISDNGRFVAFSSYATNLVSGDTNAYPDVFLRDRKTGTTERISVSSLGAQGNNASETPSVSANGRFVAFFSDATTLVDGDTNGYPDIFVRDRQTGTTELVSKSSAGLQTNGDVRYPLISANGRYVAFYALASNLVPGDLNAVEDVFVHDRVTRTTEMVSVDPSGQPGDGDSRLTSISADGRYVAFQSNADNLVPGDTNGQKDVFVRDRLIGATTRISIDTSGAQGNDDSYEGSLSPDGRFVAFSSFAWNLAPLDTNSRRDVFVHDRLAGTTVRVTYGIISPINDNAMFPAISAGGRFVAFMSLANNLVAGDTNASNDIFVTDRGPQPDRRDDLLVDFGAAGLWQLLNNATWQKIHNVSPLAVAAGDLDGSLQDEVIASFAGAGLWARYDNAGWVKLHNASPVRFVAGDLDGNGSDELVADFGAAGLWARYNNATWKKVRNAASEALAVADLDGNGRGELVADLGAAGLWVLYNNGAWAKLHNGNPKSLAVGDLDGNSRDELIVDFGGAGIWARFNNAAWQRLDTRTSQGLATGDLDGNRRDELLADFGPGGLWVRYDSGSWAKRHNGSPQRMLASSLDGNGKAEAVLDFGPKGLWVLYDNTSWAKLHPATTQGLAAGGFD